MAKKTKTTEDSPKEKSPKTKKVSKKTKKAEDIASAEDVKTDVVSDLEDNTAKEDEAASEEPKPKKEKKVVYLKQWLVSGKAENGKDVADFYLATCGMKAREAYAKRNGEKSIVYLVMQTAESSHEASWLEDHDSYQWTMKK